MASLTRWAWVWVNSGSWWWTGRPGVLRFMESQKVRHDWTTELNCPGFLAPLIKERLFFFVVYSCLLCQREGVHCHVGFYLGFLSCSIFLYFSFCASTILELCSTVWSQDSWFMQLSFSFSRLIWIFEVFCVSKPVMKIFVLVLWRIPLVVS